MIFCISIKSNQIKFNFQQIIIDNYSTVFAIPANIPAKYHCKIVVQNIPANYPCKIVLQNIPANFPFLNIFKFSIFSSIFKFSIFSIIFTVFNISNF